MRPRIGMLKTALLCVLVAVAGTGLETGCGDDGGYSGPAEPLLVAAIFTVQPDGTVTVIVSLSNSLSPINFVNDATVTINGVPIPKYEQGYLYMGNAISVSPGDDVTLVVKRGLTITATLTFPGKAEFVSPAGGSVHDPTQPIDVEITPPSVEPEVYSLNISDEFTDSIMGWNGEITPPDTTTQIQDGMLLAGQSGITIRCQSDNRTETFEGETLGSSYFTVANISESAAFSTSGQ